MKLIAYLCSLSALLIATCQFNIAFANGHDSVQVTLSPRVIGDTASNSSVREVLDLWRNYLNSRPDSIYDNPYWSIEERQKFKNFDLSGSMIYGQGKNFLNQWKPLVLSVDSISKGYLIQTAYVQCDTDYFYQSLWAVQNVFAKRERGVWRLFNALPYESAKLCNERKIGRFRFVYSKDHRFNELLARNTVTFADSLSKIFSVPLRDTFEYYVTDNVSDLTELMGMTFCLSMSTGITYPDDARIFTASGLEFYPHELTHLVCGTCGSRFASEGIATWQGGSNYKEGTLQNTVREARGEIHSASELSLDSLIANPYYSRSTSLFYATGGMVAALIYHFTGAKGIRELRDAKQSELVATIEKLIDDTPLTVGTIWHRYSLLNPDENDAKK